MVGGPEAELGVSPHSDTKGVHTWRKTLFSTALCEDHV